MNPRIRLALISFLCAGIAFLIGFIGRSQLPRAKTWALVKIEAATRENSPIRALPGDLEFNLFPPSVTLSQVKIKPTTETEKYFDTFEINRLRLRLNIWSLMTGHLALKGIDISGSDPVVRIPKSQSQKSERPLDGLFEIIHKLPMQNLTIEDFGIHLILARPRLNIQIQKLDLEFEKVKKGAELHAKIPALRLLEPQTHRKIDISANLDLAAYPDHLDLTELTLLKEDSFLVVSGNTKGDIEGLKFREYEFKTRGALSLEAIREWVIKAYPEYNTLPKFSGNVKMTSVFTEQDKKRFVALDLGADHVSYDHFFFGDVAAKGEWRAGAITKGMLTVKNSAGEATATNISGTANEDDIRLKAEVHTPHLEAYDLLKNFGIGPIPVWLDLKGTLPCDFTILPAFAMRCEGELAGKNALVRPALDTDKTIVNLPQFSAQGEVSADAHAVTYKAKLSMPHSSGASDGKIDFDNGFKINYSADQLDFQDIANLSDLKIEGVTKIQGSTEGGSHAATLALNFDGQNFYLNDFYLGSARGSLSYAKGILGFKNLTGHYKVSNYQGDVRLNIPEKQIDVTGKMPFIETHDLLGVFARMFTPPVELKGTGSATIHAWGPLQLGALSYDLKSTLLRGSVNGETFEQAHFDIHSRKGEAVVDRVDVLKEGATIVLTGVGHPSGEIETVVKGRGLKLEDSAHVISAGLNVSGHFDFDMDLTGPILKPDTNFRGHITKMAIGDLATPDSNLNLKFLKKTIEGDAALFANTVRSTFVLPLDPGSPFLLDLETSDWNFAPIFSAFTSAGVRKDFDTRLTSNLHLTSKAGGFWNSSGALEISKFSIRRGALAMTAPRKISVGMNQGRMQIADFYLEGDNTYLRINDSPKPTQKVDLQVNGKINMSLLSIALPFFEELRGILSLAFNLRMGTEQTSVLGSAYIDHGFLKLFDFPHPFEEIKSDILFNHQKVLINSLKSDFAGGQISGDGTLEIRGYKNFPLNLGVNLDRITLNLPDKFLTRGSGHLAFTGSWFPFAMKGSYEVTGGLVTMEFGGNASPDKSNARRSALLPQFLQQETFVPLDLDVDVQLAKGLPIKNSLVEGSINGEVKIRGAPGKNILLGQVGLGPETKVKFRDQLFDVTNATFTFDDPKEINPKLYLNGRARVQSYDVTMLVTGMGQDPKVNLSSQPPLSETDLVSLLAFGTTSTKLGTEVSTSQQGANNGFALASGIIKDNPIGQELKQRFGVDLQFTSGYDETNSSAKQTITASGKFTEKLGWVFNRSTGQYTSNEAKLKYKLSDKVSVVGTYDVQSVDGATAQQSNISPNVLGLDIEYRLQFK